MKIRQLVLMGAMLMLFPIFTCKGAPHYMTLQWTPSSDAAAHPTLAYNIYRGTSPGGQGATPINATPVGAGCTVAAGNCTYQDDNVGLGTWYYTMKAIVNGALSPPSNEASGTITPAAPTAVVVIPH